MSTEAQRAIKRKYNQSPKGKENRQRWRDANRARERAINRKYEGSLKGKAADRRYVSSDKGKAAHARYLALHPDQRAKTLCRYKASELGKATAREHSRQWRLEHLEQSRAMVHRYQAAHKDEIEARRKRLHRELKIRVLTHYGNGQLSCVQCKEARLACLSIDHKANNGYEHRKVAGNGGRMYIWLEKQNYPEGYQTLCMNCQFLKKHGDQ